MFCSHPEPSLEESPKWKALKEILQEIESDLSDPETPDVARGGSIVVAVSDERTCGQLREVSRGVEIVYINPRFHITSVRKQGSTWLITTSPNVDSIHYLSHGGTK